MTECMFNNRLNKLEYCVCCGFHSIKGCLKDTNNIIPTYKFPKHHKLNKYAPKTAKKTLKR